MTGALESIAGLRILIVEDEAPIVEEMAERLTRAGCKIICTTDNGRGAIEAAVATASSRPTAMSTTSPAPISPVIFPSTITRV